MTKAAYLISALILIAAGVACARVPVQPNSEPIIITPVAFQTQTPPDIIVATPAAVQEVPTATLSLRPTPTPTPWPIATATYSPTEAPSIIVTPKPMAPSPTKIYYRKPVVNQGDRISGGGTTYALAYDGEISTYLEANYHTFLQLDFNNVVDFSGFRRYMTRDGIDVTGYRDAQEQVSYSWDGMNWRGLSVDTTRGWEDYTMDSPTFWRGVGYGWSPWLRLKTPVRARHIRYYWNSDNDALNEIELDWVFPPR